MRTEFSKFINMLIFFIFVSFISCQTPKLNKETVDANVLSDDDDDWEMLNSPMSEASSNISIEVKGNVSVYELTLEYSTRQQLLFDNWSIENSGIEISKKELARYFLNYSSITSIPSKLKWKEKAEELALDKLFSEGFGPGSDSLVLTARENPNIAGLKEEEAVLNFTIISSTPRG